MDSQRTRVDVQVSPHRLLSWLIEDACPLWSTRGVDSVLGGFQELMNGEEPVVAPRRVRVQPRQVAAFIGAARLGWPGDAAELAVHGLSYLFAHYRRSDGLFRTLVAPDGRVIDDRALLYDQTFVLLGLAESDPVLNGRAASPLKLQPMEEARALRELISLHFGRKRPGHEERGREQPGGETPRLERPGFESAVEGDMPLSANAHMHLFEASLACHDGDIDPKWSALVDSIGELALTQFIHPESGALREHFDSNWVPLMGTEGRLLEPGHHFEWAWLLLRWAGESRADARQAALRLFDIAERHGVREGVAVNALLDDFSIHDGCARLWPQTERLKAAALAARLTGESRYFSIATEAADTIWRYLQTPVRGSWYDRLMPYGRFIEEPAPASTFYHLVGAISEWTRTCESLGLTAPRA